MADDGVNYTFVYQFYCYVHNAVVWLKTILEVSTLPDKVLATYILLLYLKIEVPLMAYV
jgi:hypothetical protein